MTNSRFENILATFCSPALMGKKVSNLVSVSKEEVPEVSTLVNSYNQKLNRHDIKIKKVCECGERILLLVYREELLRNHLLTSEIREILMNYGYSKSNTIDEDLEILSRKMQKIKFPHEIGVFLGYPLSDVQGFIENKGRNYKYCGYWKVYKDTQEAQKIFLMYDDLKNFMISELDYGRNLDNIIGQFQNINIA
ncbi:hypothetical protein UF10_08610 [Peptostreptococcus russellii]|uniref:DUF3793 domain-containing protein n=1 Tax=Peptostreptococcus russellii TaxID=215200 RepID=A0A2P7PYX7_9FIRM|nr:DUF3793 family protein [Peptostreptococcus russellii]PSJ30908.1 hypothetical protein UF10_08610 [Peptostreptococcus russellii]